MKHLIYLALFFLNATIAFGQKELIIADVTENNLPQDVKFEGRFKQALRWKDKLGDNLLVISETGIYGSERRHAEIFAFHFLRGETLKLNWNMHDFEKDCPVDVEAEFLEDAIDITDLDGDGISEIWLIYKKACRGDVSPSEMKIIMHEGLKKYAMRGENKVKVSQTESIGGKYRFDDAFNQAPAFKKFALQKWNENILQKW